MKISSFMKGSFLLVFVALLQFTANAAGQTPVSIHMKNVEINQVFATLEKESGYHFLFNSRLTGLNKLVNVDADNADISEVLKSIFAGTNLQYKMLDNKLIVISSSDVDQDIVISGKVTNQNNEPLPGVSITVKGRATGTTSDANGNFTLSVPENGVIEISSIGYLSQELPVNNQTELNIKMVQSSNTMDQVVVIGYGSQQKKYITGATVSVSGTELVKQPVLTATQAMQGKAAGVQIISSGQPGSQPSVRIRGTGSLLGGAEPLYVVDGILTSDITNINNADILNVDVLKDASTTAIYGARGSNGVIIITTKQGVGKMQITYSGNFGVQSATHLVPMANSTQYIAYVQAALGPVPAPTGYSTDWYSQILRNAFQQNHNVTVSGSSDRVKYLFSAGYMDDQGIVINNDFKRFTLRSNDEFKLAKNLTLGILTSFTEEINQNVNLIGAYNDAYRAAPVIPGVVNGKYGNTSLFQNVGNPVLDINNSNNRQLNSILLGNGFLEYKPITSLSLKTSMGVDYGTLYNRGYTYQFFADSNTFVKPGGNQSNANSTLNIITGNNLHWIWDLTATYTKTFGVQHLSALIGTTAEENNSTSVNAIAEGVPADPSLWYLHNANNALPFSNDGYGTKQTRNSYLARVNYNYDEKYLLTVNFRADGASNFPANNRWGYFPSAGAGWIVTNEKFMEDQKIFDFLKLKGSWGKSGNDVTEAGTQGYTLTLVQNLPYYFNGTGVSGSAVSQIVDQNLKWETSTEYDLGIDFTILKSRLTGEVSYYDKKVENALIYVLIPSSLGSYNPSGGGQGYVLTNAASIENKGVELTLTWKDKISKDFSYSIGGNITFNQNNVIGLNGGQPYIDGPIGADQPDVTRTDNGHPIGSFYVQKVLGVFQSQAEIDGYTDKNGNILQPGAVPGDFKYQYNANGKLDSVFAGSYQPKAFYGINIGVQYKAFDLSIGGYGTYGGKIYNGKKAFRQSLQDNVESSTANNRWTNSNHTNSEPRANGGYLPASTYFVESGSYFRLNNINLGYTLPNAMVQKTKVFSSVRIYLVAQNILTITKYSGFTPELQNPLPITPSLTSAAPPTTSATNAGIELNAYPSVRTISVGLNIGF
jgi:TonB-dependent starch-binding outer membrane protein SusC